MWARRVLRLSTCWMGRSAGCGEVRQKVNARHSYISLTYLGESAL